MHYLGMWALEVPGRVTWSPDLVLFPSFSGCSLATPRWRSLCAIVVGWGTFVSRAVPDARHCLTSFHRHGRGADRSRSDAWLRRTCRFLPLPRLGDCRRGSVGARDEFRRRAGRSPPCHPNPQIRRNHQPALPGPAAGRRLAKELQEQKLRLDTAINNMGEAYACSMRRSDLSSATIAMPECTGCRRNC